MYVNDFCFNMLYLRDPSAEILKLCIPREKQSMNYCFH